ncbi:MAG: hypothetical protein ABSE99_04795, partial [Terracidiphilus sp.]
LLQDPDDLLFRESALLHPVLPFRLRENSSFQWSSFPGAGQAVLVPSVISLSSWQNRQASAKQNLENLSAVILKDVVYSVFRCELLELPDAGHQSAELRLIGMWLHACPFASRSTTSTPRIIASRSILSMEIFFSFRSTLPI